MSSAVSSTARLFAKYGRFRGLDLELGEVTHIGRGDDNDVVLADPAVSQHHASIEFDADAERYVLIDRESSNGTFLDGAPVRGRATLGEVGVIGIAGVGDLLFAGPSLAAAGDSAPRSSSAGHSTVDVPDRTTIEEGPEFLADALSRIGAERQPSPDATAADLAAPVLPSALGGPRADESSSTTTGTGTGSARGGWVLVVQADGRKVRFPLARGSQVVGRGARVEVRIDHPHLSRQHARIDVGDTVAVEDLGSSNHTFVQGRAITHRTELEEGSHLAFGDVRAQVVFEPEE